MGLETSIAYHHHLASLRSAPQQSHKMSIWLPCTLIFKLRRRSMPQVLCHSFYNGTALTNVSCPTESDSNRNFCMKFCELIKDWFLQRLSVLCKSMPCLNVSGEFVPSSLFLLTTLMARSSKLAEVRCVS